jgi:hypothetical protein
MAVPECCQQKTTGCIADRCLLSSCRLHSRCTLESGQQRSRQLSAPSLFALLLLLLLLLLRRQHVRRSQVRSAAIRSQPASQQARCGRASDSLGLLQALQVTPNQQHSCRQ